MTENLGITLREFAPCYGQYEVHTFTQNPRTRESRDSKANASNDRDPEHTYSSLGALVDSSINDRILYFPSKTELAGRFQPEMDMERVILLLNADLGKLSPNTRYKHCREKMSR